jgi:hypothetical protein
MVLAPKYDADGPVTIAEIMQAIKGASAHRINKALVRRGKIWEEESFDRALRWEESVVDKVDYILGNPVGAGARHQSAGISLVVEGNGDHMSFLQKNDGRGRPSSIFSYRM